MISVLGNLGCDEFRDRKPVQVREQRIVRRIDYMSKLRVFVSSVQKELENERVAVAEIVWTDPFLTAHSEPVLYEFEPASPDKALEGCLKTLDCCQVYVVIIWNEYGHIEGDLAITHHEYRWAKAHGLPILVFIKGTDEAKRSEDLNKKLLAEVKTDGFKYKRFSNYRDLQTEVRAALAMHLKEKHGIEPSSDENEIAAQTIEAASAFGKQRLTDVGLESFNLDLAQQLVSVADGIASTALTKDDIERGLLSRSLLWQDPESGASRPWLRV